MLSAGEAGERTFKRAVGGYDRSDVEAFRQEVVEALRVHQADAEAVQRELQAAEERTGAAQKVLEKALETRQEILDRTQSEAAGVEERAAVFAAEAASRAAAEADAMRSGAEADAERIRQEAAADADRTREELEAERGRLRSELGRLRTAIGDAERRLHDIAEGMRRDVIVVRDLLDGEAGAVGFDLADAPEPTMGVVVDLTGVEAIGEKASKWESSALDDAGPADEAGDETDDPWRRRNEPESPRRRIPDPDEKPGYYQRRLAGLRARLEAVEAGEATDVD